MMGFKPRLGAMTGLHLRAELMLCGVASVQQATKPLQVMSVQLQSEVLAQQAHSHGVPAQVLNASDWS